MTLSRRIFVVDDDPSVCMGLCRLLRSVGYEPEAFNSAKSFVEQYRGAPGCLLLDISMPSMSGIELQAWLAQLNHPLSVVLLTGRVDIPTSLQAMENSAVDLLTKPVDEATLLSALEEGLRRDAKNRALQAERDATLARLATLTPREREVFEHIVCGHLNTPLVADPSTVQKTIEIHRASVMQKMGVGSAAELARLAERIGLGALPHPPARRPTASPRPGDSPPH